MSELSLTPQLSQALKERNQALDECRSIGETLRDTLLKLNEAERKARAFDWLERSKPERGSHEPITWDGAELIWWAWKGEDMVEGNTLLEAIENAMKDTE